MTRINGQSNRDTAAAAVVAVKTHHGAHGFCHTTLLQAVWQLQLGIYPLGTFL